MTDLCIFDYLMAAHKDGSGVTAAQLARYTGADEELIGRYMFMYFP